MDNSNTTPALRRAVNGSRPLPQPRITGPLRSAMRRKPKLRFEWAESIESDQWEVYRSSMRALRQAQVPFLLGGGFALAIYIGRWRNTKDIDFYVTPENREAAIAALTDAGFKDYFEVLPYDRKWIYRSTRDGVIVDIIWAMANQRTQVDELWFEHAPAALIRGETLPVVPMEEFIWCKLYILQRDHCDWTDILNLLYVAGREVNWEHLLWRLEEDWPLLKALLTVYGWVCPGEAALLPASLRRRLNLSKPEKPRAREWNRIRLLDSRDWFGASLDPETPLKV